MIDTVRLNIKGGDGGNGCASFLREKYRPMGGPNGGDGGNGGNAYIVGDPSLNTLLHLKFNSTIYTERGKHGKGKEMRGGNGEDDIIRVPLGTLVRRRDSDGGARGDGRDLRSGRSVARGGARSGSARAMNLRPTDCASSTNTSLFLSCSKDAGNPSESHILNAELIVTPSTRLAPLLE